MISTKGRYAVRVLIDLSEQGEGACVPLRDIANRQGISEKYLQHIAKRLVDEGVLLSVSGKGGGYRMARPADELSVLEVIEAAEGTLAPVACLAPHAEPCDRAAGCKTLPLWQRYYAGMREFFGSITVGDLAAGKLSVDDLSEFS